MRTGITGQVSFDELVAVQCPLVNLSIMLNRLKEKSGGSKEANRAVDCLLFELDRAESMLLHILSDMEGDNPEFFGDEIISTVVLDYIEQKANECAGGAI